MVTRRREKYRVALKLSNRKNCHLVSVVPERQEDSPEKGWVKRQFLKLRKGRGGVGRIPWSHLEDETKMDTRRPTAPEKGVVGDGPY